MARRRHKGGRKTHKELDEETLRRIPRSFVVKVGKCTKSVKTLSRDLRQIYRPWTAVNLREQRRATVKDYTNVSSVLSISHMIFLRQKGSRVYASFLRTRSGEGPTCNFRVLNYSLLRDISKAQTKPRSNELDYQMSPLVVTCGFGAKKKNDDKFSDEVLADIKSRLFSQAFPILKKKDSEDSSLAKVRRVVLFAYTGEGIFEMRHFAISKTQSFKDQFQTKTKVKRSPYKDELKKEEAIPVKKEELDEVDKIEFLRKNLSLVELGPRLSLKLSNYQPTLASNLVPAPEGEDDGENNGDASDIGEADEADEKKSDDKGRDKGRTVRFAQDQPSSAG